MATIPGPSQTQILHAYRHLLKASLRAIQYAKPARYTALQHVRDAFRLSHASAYDEASIKRTLEFLNHAAKTRGLEHRIMKNVVRVWGERRALVYAGGNVRREVLALRKEAYDDFDRTVASLNESLGLCIK